MKDIIGLSLINMGISTSLIAILINKIEKKEEIDKKTKIILICYAISIINLSICIIFKII